MIWIHRNWYWGFGIWIFLGLVLRCPLLCQMLGSSSEHSSLSPEVSREQVPPPQCTPAAELGCRVAQGDPGPFPLNKISTLWQVSLDVPHSKSRSIYNVLHSCCYSPDNFLTYQGSISKYTRHHHEEKIILIRKKHLSVQRCHYIPIYTNKCSWLHRTKVYISLDTLLPRQG